MNLSSLFYAMGLGLPELILLALAGFILLVIFGILFVIYSSIKRRNSFQQYGVPPNVAINFGTPSGVNNVPVENNTPQPNSKNEKVALPQQHEIRYVFVNEIVRCEADDNYTNFYLASAEKILISKSLKEYADLLTPYGFLRTHQSHLINPSFVKSWLKEDGGVLLMINGDKIPVSKPNRESVKGLLSK
jgi:two-component system LytT family response regulator